MERKRLNSEQICMLSKIYTNPTHISTLNPEISDKLAKFKLVKFDGGYLVCTSLGKRLITKFIGLSLKFLNSKSLKEEDTKRESKRYKS